MGVLTSLSGALGVCSRRRPQDKSSPTVCPISGRAGVCPVSGQASNAKAPAPAAAQKAAPSKPKEEAPSPEAVAEAAEHKERGNAHFKKGELEEALQAYAEALFLTKRDPALWLNRSIVNRQLKNWEDARDDAEISAGLDPSNAKAHYSLALSLQQLGELKRALSACEKGLRVQPENKALAQLRGTLKQAAAAPGSAGGRARAPARAEGDANAAALQQDAAQDASEKCPASKLSASDVEEIRQVAEAYEWKGRDPSEAERDGLKSALVDMFRNKYLELKASAASHKKGTALSTDQYEKDQKLGLQLEGGHRPMRRPDHVDLPDSYREYLGVISVNELGRYSADNEDRRYLLSIYGKLFDVSDRPDKYGPEGPYASLTGKDLTWGLVAGVDTPDFCNRCYDLFKAKDQGKDKLAGICSWLAWYETEYGEPVGQLEPFTRERELPAPPLQEMEENCTVM